MQHADIVKEYVIWFLRHTSTKRALRAKHAIKDKNSAECGVSPVSALSQNRVSDIGLTAHQHKKAISRRKRYKKNAFIMHLLKD